MHDLPEIPPAAPLNRDSPYSEAPGRTDGPYPAEYRPPAQASRHVPCDEPVEPKHSGLGLAGFILSLALGLLILVVFAIAGVVQVSTPGGVNEKSPAAVIIGIAIIGLVLSDLLALGLAIAGLFQRNRKRVFATLGAIIAGVSVLGTVVLIIVGTLMK